MPATRPPQPVFDAHFHIIDPRFPVVVNAGFVPAPFTVDDYRAATQSVHMVGGAVVSGSFQGADTTYLADALPRLGPGYVAVVEVESDVSSETLRALHAMGVRGARFNLYRGTATPNDLSRLGTRLHDEVGWHVELYVDSKDLTSLQRTLTQLPKVSIDHLGMSEHGLDTLLALMERGVFVKATGFGRVHLDVEHTLRCMAAVAPQQLMFGTDLPSTRARRPFEWRDGDTLVECVGKQWARAVLCDNARAFYGVGGVEAAGDDAASSASG